MCYPDVFIILPHPCFLDSPGNPLLQSRTEVYKGIHTFFFFLLNTEVVGAPNEAVHTIHVLSKNKKLITFPSNNNRDFRYLHHQVGFHVRTCVLYNFHFLPFQ